MKKEKYIKAKATKKKILDTSLKLFLEEGYEKATMRNIAKLANLTAGATYYYFPTKEHIIFHFYTQTFEEQLKTVERVLNNQKKLQDRISAVLKAHLDMARPYHEVSKALFKVAADPAHPLSPYSKESREFRERDIGILREVIDGTTDKVPNIIKGKLPDLLWLYKIGIILFWIHDHSPAQRKTYNLIDRSSVLLVKIISISNLPLIRNFINQLVELIDEFKPY